MRKRHVYFIFQALHGGKRTEFNETYAWMGSSHRAGHLADVVSQVVNYQRLCSRVSPRERVQTQALDFVCALHAVTNSARVVRACLMATSSLCESIAQAAAVCKASADIAAVDATACKQLYDAITEFVEVPQLLVCALRSLYHPLLHTVVLQSQLA